MHSLNSENSQDSYNNRSDNNRFYNEGLREQQAPQIDFLISDISMQLLKDLQKSNQLPEYNELAIREIVAEMNDANEYLKNKIDLFQNIHLDRIHYRETQHKKQINSQNLNLTNENNRNFEKMSSDNLALVEGQDQLKEDYSRPNSNRNIDNTVSQQQFSTSSLNSKSNDVSEDQTSGIEVEAQGEILPDSYKAVLTLRHAAIEENKRRVLAYLNYRLQHIKRLQQETGNNLPNQQLRSKLSEHELQFHTRYSDLLSRYNCSMKTVLNQDLTPPFDLMQEVRVIKPHSESILTETGQLDLKPNQTYSLKRIDAQMLIYRGLVVPVETGDSFTASSSNIG